MTKNRIETASREDEVLELAAAGKSTREIAEHLRAHGLDVSHTAVGRFLRNEANDRALTRKAVTEGRAHELAASAGQDADKNLDAIKQLIPTLAMMATRGVRRVAFPEDAQNMRAAHDASEAEAVQQLMRIEAGQREWWEPIPAKDAIRAASVLKDAASYLVELASGNPTPVDRTSLESVRAAIAEVFGYGVPTDPNDPQNAPMGPDEHTPPVKH
jgi:hypothetical protein